MNAKLLWRRRDGRLQSTEVVFPPWKLYLIVLADRKADDLINVRIARSLDMISSHMKEKYPALLSLESVERKSVKSVEATHV